MPRFRGIILDVDGTLIDSNDAHAHSWVWALRRFGHAVRYDQVRRLIGMGGDNLLPRVAQLEKESQEGTQIAKRYLEIFKAHYLPHLKPLPGASALVEHLKHSNFRIAVGSSAEADVLETLLDIAQVKDLIEETVSSKDAENSKPAPDVILVALDRLQLPPEEVIMLGDTPFDIASATKAGVRTIALRSGGWTDADLDEALAIYDDPADLLAHYNQSPLVE
jgi:HAD superfamily hydrolase (TIGR01509 family)